MEGGRRKQAAVLAGRERETRCGAASCIRLWEVDLLWIQLVGGADARPQLELMLMPLPLLLM